MLRLDEVLYEGDGETAYRLSRKYGADPLNVLVELETKEEVKRNLAVLLEELKPLQREILLMTGLGYTTRAIAAEINRNHATVIGCRRSIRKRLLATANEDRIERLKEMLEHVKGGYRKKLTEEYRRRHAVREALKNLFVALSPLEPPSFTANYSTTPTMLFERVCNTGKNKDCRLPQYLSTSFKDDKTVCPLCKKCAGK